ncbi:hypothetical protein R2571_006810 [Pseudomonas aeruginosa]|nr:hypothetical protein [Pseudomonas aeruginosa]
MKNPEDYQSGWTQPIFNPRTGLQCSGGAARNIRLAQVGGAEALFNAGGVNALNQVTPLVQQLQAQLATAQLINQEMARQLGKGDGKRSAK